MKRIIYLLIPVLIALTVLSCKRDYDDDYMGSVDERLNATLTAYQNELTSAEHGWMANISTSEGIYRFWMKFYVNNGEVMNDLKGNRVTMITDNMNYDYSGVNGGTAVPGTSSFRLKALQRPTLIFDTYSYLAVLCDPDDNVSHGSGNQGLQTDFEYEIASYEDSVFTLRGRTHRANATLVKATAEEERAASQAGMVKSIEALSRFIASQNYSYIETQKYGPVLFNFNLRSMSTSYEAADGKSLVHSDVTDSYVDFDQNIILPEPIEVADQVVVTQNLEIRSRTGRRLDDSASQCQFLSYSSVGMDRARVQSGIQYDRHSDQLDRRNLLELSFGGAISYPLCRAADGLRAGTGSGEPVFPSEIGRKHVHGVDAFVLFS